MTFTTNLHDSERLIPPAAEPANKHWLLLATHQLYMTQIKNDCVQWWIEYEDSSSLIFDPDTAAHLCETAPSDYAAGLLMGRLLLLKELEAMGRANTTTI